MNQLKLERLAKQDVSYVSADFPSTTTNSYMEYKQERKQSADFGGSKSKCLRNNDLIRTNPRRSSNWSVLGP